MESTEVVVVLSTHPVLGAEDFARSLVEKRLAACVQTLAGVRSFYRWKGQVETAEEVRLEIKTTRDRLPGILSALQEGHPYDVPEMVVVPVTGGLPSYLDWVREEVRPISG